MGNADSVHHDHQQQQHQLPHLVGSSLGGGGDYFDSAPTTLQHHPHQHPNQQQQPNGHRLASRHPLYRQSTDATGTGRSQQPLQPAPSPNTSTSIRVLPKLSEQTPPGLRATNNGLILHGGGTLSARPPSGGGVGPTARAMGGLTVNQLAATKQAAAPAPFGLVTGLPPLMKRSRTQHDMLPRTTAAGPMAGAAMAPNSGGPAPNGWAANSRRYHHNQMRGGGGGVGQSTAAPTVAAAKQFGSESNLAAVPKVAANATRFSPSGRDGSEAAGALTQSGLKAISRALPSAKKYSAPQPPQQQQQAQQQQPPTAFVAPVPRKLRMFKTKAESRKSGGGGAGSSTTLAEDSTQTTSTTTTSREPISVRRSHSPLERYSHHQSPSSLLSPQHSNTASNHNYNHHTGATQLPRIESHIPATASATTAAAARMQASFLRREKSFDLNLLRSHIVQSPTAASHRHDAATESTSGSIPIRTDFQQELMAATERKQRESSQQRSRLPVPRSRQMQQPQLLGLIDLDRRSEHPITPIRFHVSAEDENNNTNHPNSTYPHSHPHLSTAYNLSAMPQEHILDEYLTKSIQLDAINRFTDALQQQLPADSRGSSAHHPLSPAERYLSPPVVDDAADYPPQSCSSSRTSDTTTSSCLSYRGDLMAAEQQHLRYLDELSPSATSAKQINITVRPTLPRRQFDIPRFNPAEAWRSLNEVLSAAGGGASAAAAGVGGQANGGPYYVRESAVVLGGGGGGGLRPIQLRGAAGQLGGVGGEAHRALYDSSRSAESGISSGEDFSGNCAGDNKPGGGLLPAVRANGLAGAWTPQQDLDDDDDDCGDGGADGDGDDDADDIAGRGQHAAVEHFYPEVTENITRSRQRNHCSMFSLSLPRDTHMTSSNTDGAATIEGKPMFSSLKKQREAAVSGAAAEPLAGGDNWLLSSSAPNSMDVDVNNNAVKGGGSGSGSRCSADRQRPAPPLAYFSGGPHVMCLPADNTGSSGGSADPLAPDNGGTSMPTAFATVAHQRLATKFSGQHPHHHHRFTFQSTVRQVERRRVAERLSSEAALKEAQRRNELESMQRVEEEFQRKRSREKSTAAAAAAAALKYQQQQHQQSYRSLPAAATATSPDRTHHPTEADGRHTQYHDQYTAAGGHLPVDTHSPYIGRLVEQKSAGSRMHGQPLMDGGDKLY